MTTAARGLLIDDGVWAFVFVSCIVCTRYISNEDAHTCELSHAYAFERNAARAAKMNALAQQRNDRRRR